MTMNPNANAMESNEFVARLDEEIGAMLARIGQMSASAPAPETLTVERLLRLALKNELEAAELAATWLATTQELDVKLALARQCGDEAKHYRMIVERLEAMGVDATNIDPRVGGYSPLFEFLRALESTPARVASGQFTREGLALVRNQAFIEFCEARDDHETAALYRNVIQPDEQHHHELGRRLLARYAVTVADQQVAHDAARRTLELAEEVQEVARMKAGISHAPGC